MYIQPDSVINAGDGVEWTDPAYCIDGNSETAAVATSVPGFVAKYLEFTFNTPKSFDGVKLSIGWGGTYGNFDAINLEYWNGSEWILLFHEGDTILGEKIVRSFERINGATKFRINTGLSGDENEPESIYLNEIAFNTIPQACGFLVGGLLVR
jgi:hypothetical protein